MDMDQQASVIFQVVLNRVRTEERVMHPIRARVQLIFQVLTAAHARPGGRGGNAQHQSAHRHASMERVRVQIPVYANLAGKTTIAQNQFVRNHARTEEHVMNPILASVPLIFPATIAAHVRSDGKA